MKNNDMPEGFYGTGESIILKRSREFLLITDIQG